MMHHRSVFLLRGRAAVPELVCAGIPTPGSGAPQPVPAPSPDHPAILDVGNFEGVSGTQRHLTAPAEPAGDPVYRAEVRTQIERCPDLLGWFEEAHAAESDAHFVPTPRYARGNTLRVSGPTTEASPCLEETDAAFQGRDAADGYVPEEPTLGYDALGHADQARAFARRACRLLVEDAWFRDHATDRLERLRTLAGEDEGCP